MPPNVKTGQYVEKRFRPDPDNVEVRELDDGDGSRKQIRMPVSSTAKDRDGDQFSEDGLEDLQRQINEDKIPMFLDHGRGSRGSYYGALGMVGRWDSADIEQEGDVKVLYATGTPTTANPDAEDMVALIEDDMPVGSSVGFRVLDYEGDRQDGYEFHETDLLEISNVGIPSNPETVNAGDGAVGVAAAMKHARGGLVAQVADELERRGAGGPVPDSDAEAKHADTPPMTDDPDDPDKELVERVVGIQERMADTLDDMDERLSALETTNDPDDDPDGDGGSKSETDSDPEPDRRELSVFLDEDADEKAVAEFEQLSEAADEGEIDLADSDTKLFATDEETTDDEDEGLI